MSISAFLSAVHVNIQWAKKSGTARRRSAVYMNGPRLGHDRSDKKPGTSKDIPDIRRRAELNRCIRVLQTRPLPLGYDAVYEYIK